MLVAWPPGAPGTQAALESPGGTAWVWSLLEPLVPRLPWRAPVGSSRFGVSGWLQQGTAWLVCSSRTSSRW